MVVRFSDFPLWLGLAAALVVSDPLEVSFVFPVLVVFQP